MRKCDRCGEIFSELDDGWQTYTATTKRRDEYGVEREIRLAMDACPACAMVPTPHGELESGETPRDVDVRIAKLEKELGIGQTAKPRTTPRAR